MHVIIEMLGEVRDKAIRLIQATYLSIYFRLLFLSQPSHCSDKTVLYGIVMDLQRLYRFCFLHGIAMDLQRLYRCFLIRHRDGSAAFISVFSYKASRWICSVYIGVFLYCIVVVVVVVVVVFISNCILLLFTYISDYISLHIIYNLWYVHKAKACTNPVINRTVNLYTYM